MQRYMSGFLTHTRMYIYLAQKPDMQGCICTKDYILVIDGTAPAIVLQRCDSPNLSPLCLQYNQLPDRLTEQAGRGWVSHIFVRR